jgi:cysteinyl-tRNA synthetase
VLNKWYRTIEKFQNHAFFGGLGKFAEDNREKIEEIGGDFLAAMYDDLNTPVAIQAFTKMVKDLENKGDDYTLAAVLVCSNIIGFLSQSAASWFQHGSVGAIPAEEIEAMIAARKEARENRDFQKADQIRDDLLAKGVQIEDSATGTTWHRV